MRHVSYAGAHAHSPVLLLDQRYQPLQQQRRLAALRAHFDAASPALKLFLFDQRAAAGFGLIRESYYEEVKTFKTNLDVVRECRCENSLMTLDVAKARVAAARGPADQADADRRLKLAMEQKKSDCDVSGDANNFHHVGPSEPAASLNPEGVEVK